MSKPHRPIVAGGTFFGVDDYPDVKPMARKVAALFEALSALEGSWTPCGEIQEAAHRLRMEMHDRLKADGWDVRIPHNKYTVKLMPRPATPAQTAPPTSPQQHIVTTVKSPYTDATCNNCGCKIAKGADAVAHIERSNFGASERPAGPYVTYYGDPCLIVYLWCSEKCAHESGYAITDGTEKYPRA